MDIRIEAGDPSPEEVAALLVAIGLVAGDSGGERVPEPDLDDPAPRRAGRERRRFAPASAWRR